MPLPSNHSTIRGTPVSGIIARSGTTGIKAEPAPRFLMFWHRQQYEFVDLDGRMLILPRLAQVRLLYGANGIGGDGDTTVFEANMRRDGWMLLDPDSSVPAHLSPDGVPGYIRKYATESGFDRYEDCFVEVRAAPDGTADFVPNLKARASWLLWCMETGIIAPPSEVAIEKMLEQEETRADRKVAALSAEQAARTEAAAAVSRAERLTEALGLARKAAEPVVAAATAHAEQSAQQAEAKIEATAAQQGAMLDRIKSARASKKEGAQDG